MANSLSATSKTQGHLFIEPIASRRVSIMIDGFVNGIHPRSEALIAATRAYDRKNISQEEVELQFENDRLQVVNLQAEIGFGYVSDGMLRWNDLFRPFAEADIGMKTGSLARWFDNNTFYRKPVVESDILPEDKCLSKYYNPSPSSKDWRWKAVLPGPYTFVKCSEDRFYHDNSEFLQAVTKLLKAVCQNLAKQGYSFIQLNEPYAVHQAPDGSLLSNVIDSWNSIFDGLAAKTSIHTYFGNAAPVLDALFKSNAECIGLDFFETPVEAVGRNFGNKELACACIDSRNSFIETKSEVVDFLHSIVDRANPKGLYVCPNADLEFLPSTIAEKKLRLIGSVLEELGEE